SLGSGRVGAVAGPVIGGVLIAAGLSAPALFFVAALASLGCAVAVLSMSSAAKRVAPEVGS
ncbi:MAG: hypothetical protein JWN85_1969, partial [Gammaproteobacteria bacterium]|nr:hypothetical protein [Gammaproteobacteria bacterium]